jgi:orotidine-5'-phosphate decarboxylase
MNTRVIILPFDGMPSAQAVVDSCSNFFQNSVVSDFIAAVKLNDGLHFPRVGPAIWEDLSPIMPVHVEPFIDLKLADVSETDKNVLRRYAPYNPGIVTVSSNVTCKALIAIKEILPNARIALVDTLTDMSEKECIQRYHGQTPLEKIGHALDILGEILGADNPIEIVICSPRETAELKKRFPQYDYGNPGIRSPHMADDHQKRTTSMYDALKSGAAYGILGSQLTKGNPAKGISAEDSQKITRDEIEQFFTERT